MVKKDYTENNCTSFLDGNPLLHTLKVVFLLFLGIVIAFFEAVMQIAWGLASIFLLLGLVAFFEQDITSISPLLLNLFRFIQTNMMWFLLAFFLWYCFKYTKEVLKDE